MDSCYEDWAPLEQHKGEGRETREGPALSFFRGLPSEENEVQIVEATLAAVAGDVVATGGAFDPTGCFLGVGTALVDLGTATELTNITQATGGLATRQEVTAWSGPFTMADGTIYYEGPRMIFHPSSEDAGSILVVWFLATALTAGELIAYGAITPPANLSLSTDAWTIVLRITIGAGAVGSAEIQANG